MLFRINFDHYLSLKHVCLCVGVFGKGGGGGIGGTDVQGEGLM